MKLHHYTKKPLANPRFASHKKDPQGFYCFPESVATEAFAKLPYRYNVEISNEAQLDLESMTREEWFELIELAEKDSGATANPKVLNMVRTEDNFATRSWDLIRELFDNGLKFGIFWHQAMGYNSLLDKDGTVILPGEPQAVVLTQDAVTKWGQDKHWPQEA